jgi:hypothetical protein
MLNGDDIKLIDFGLSKFIGLSPISNQVRGYNNITDFIKAPDYRISFSTDIFSLASSMVHLCIRDYISIVVTDSKIYDKYDDTRVFSHYLSLDINFDVDGHDLLIKLLDDNVETRWCANKALLHPYFNSLRLIDNISINRQVVGMKGGIIGFKHHDKYTDKIFTEKNLELCYFEEMYYNYKDMICPFTQIKTNIDEYHILMNWILQKCNDGENYRDDKIFYGIDTIINGIIMTKNDISSYITTRKPKRLPIIHPNFIYTTFNMMLYQDITVNKRPNFRNILDVAIEKREISDLFYQYLIDINIEFYPISVHISYIYLQLAHELKTISSGSNETLQFNINFFVDLCVQILIWFIQAIPFEKDVSIWDVVVFSTIKLLSNILITSHITLIQNPIIPVLTMDLEKYEEMLEYYKVQYTSMEFDKYEQYAIYFNKPLFT